MVVLNFINEMKCEKQQLNNFFKKMKFEKKVKFEGILKYILHNIELLLSLKSNLFSAIY